MNRRALIAAAVAVALLLSGCLVKRLNESAVTDKAEVSGSFPCCILDNHEGRIIHVEFAPRSNRLVSLSEDAVDRSTLIFWHGGSGALVDSFTNINNEDSDVEFSRDGSKIGLGGRTLFLLDSNKFSLIRTFEPESYEYLKVIDLEFGGFNWPFATKRYTVEQRFRRVTSVSFSSDERYVASGHENGQVKVWEIGTGDLLNVLWATKVFGAVLDVEFSPDGRFIVACQDDERLRAWRFPDYQEKILSGHKRAVYSIDFNPVTGSLVSAGVSGVVKIWDVETGDVRREIEAHDKAIMTVAVTMDGKTLITGSKDNSVGIWNIDSGDLVTRLLGHTKQVNSVAVNSNATLLASGSDDGTVRLWDISNLVLCDNIALTPLPQFPAKLDGQVWFEDSSGDGYLSTGESGEFIITISNIGEGAAFNIVTIASPDTLYEGIEIEKPAIIPMLLPGRETKKAVIVRNNSEAVKANIVFTFRILESNGFHLNPPLKASIELDSRD
jgi:WD40 repeat protein